MKSLIFLFIFQCLLSEKVFAFWSVNYINAIDGKIETNNPRLDLTRVSVESYIWCSTGWGDGQKNCGTKNAKVKVSADGTFHLKKLQGENSNWFHGGYAIYIDDKVISQNPYSLDLDENSTAIHDLLENMTLFFLPEYTLDIKTDANIPYEDWVHTENFDSKIGYNLYFQANRDANPSMLKVIPYNYFLYTIEKNRTAIPEKLVLLPGSLQEAKNHFSINLKVRSKANGHIDSVDLIDSQIMLNSSTYQKSLESIYLNTKMINRDLTGIWAMKPHFTIKMDSTNETFIYSDPEIILDVKCQNNHLTGTANLFYSANSNYNTQKDISGSCRKGHAEFNLDFTALDYGSSDPSTNYEFRGTFLVNEISGIYAPANYLELHSQKELKSYNGFEKCKSISFNNKHFVCNR